MERKGAKGEHIYLLPTQKHTYTLIWMHGLGDTADGIYIVYLFILGFLDIFTSNMSPVSSTTKVVLLTAPVSKVTINMGM
jgi:phospholipase/carboxylesterase